MAFIMGTKRPDTIALAVILGVFLLMTVVSWQRWCNPVIDSGREMNQPLRLLRGEILYSDVYHLYGPLSPYINAGLYRVFGAHLNTLYTSGWLAGLLVTGMLYWIARTLMPPLESMLAILSIIILCIFKAAGNYISPYSYAAVHGTVFGIATVAFLIRFVQTGRTRNLTMAGVAAGLAMACKSEFGIAAMGACLVLILLRHGLERRGPWRDLVRVATPILLIVGPAYLAIFYHVPWKMVVRDTYMLLGNVPPELVYFNKVRMGLNEPLRALEEMAMAAVTLLASGALIAAISLLRAAGGHGAPEESLIERYKGRVYVLFVLASVSVVAGFCLRQLPLDRSPFRATPLILAVLLIYLGRRWLSAWNRERTLDTRYWILLILAVHSFLIISRVILRVPSGGAYGAYFLPTPLVLSIYLASQAFPAMLEKVPRAAAAAHHMTAGLLVFGTVLLVGITAYRYRHEPYYKLETARGTLQLPVGIGPAFREALNFIARNTSPDEPIFAAPEGSSLNFLGDRRTPARYEILTPGFLTPEGEREVIRRLQTSKTRYIFILNRPTLEFGPRAFGRDYCTTLMEWIENHYHIRRVFGETPPPDAQIGIKKFFIRVYERNEHDGDPP